MKNKVIQSTVYSNPNQFKYNIRLSEEKQDTLLSHLETVDVGIKRTERDSRRGVITFYIEPDESETFESALEEIDFKVIKTRN